MRVAIHFVVAGALLAWACAGSARVGEEAGVRAEVGGNSALARLVPAGELERSASQEYARLLRQASAQGALGADDHPQVLRLRAVASRIIAQSYSWNPRAREWKWEVNLIGSRQSNAFCMPGGKIAFYSGLLEQLKLDDDEVAAVMSHEVAHALREHARERLAKNAATGIGAGLVTQLLGLGQLGQSVTHYGAQLLTLSFSRQDESEADLVGMELAARAGYDPRAGLTLWRKMAAASRNAPPQWLSTHPSNSTRLAGIERHLPQVMPLYEQARGAR